jgi:hypothetical protein
MRRVAPSVMAREQLESLLAGVVDREAKYRLGVGG